MLARLHPLAKLGVALLYIAAATFSQRFAVLATIGGLTAAILLIVERISPRRLAIATAPFLFFAASSAWLYAAAPASVYGTAAGQGWATAALVGLRTITAGLVSIGFVLTTDPAELARSLVRDIHLSRRFVYGGLAAIQFVPALGEEARLARLIGRTAVPPSRSPIGRLRRSLAGFGPETGLVLMAGALRRASAAAVAMDLRGLGSTQRPSRWKMCRFQRTDLTFFSLSLVALLLAELIL